MLIDISGSQNSPIKEKLYVTNDAANLIGGADAIMPGVHQKFFLNGANQDFRWAKKKKLLNDNLGSLTTKIGLSIGNWMISEDNTTQAAMNNRAEKNEIPGWWRYRLITWRKINNWDDERWTIERHAEILEKLVRWFCENEQPAQIVYTPWFVAGYLSDGILGAALTLMTSEG